MKFDVVSLNSLLKMCLNLENITRWTYRIQCKLIAW
jgi:hypothetical protein